MQWTDEPSSNRFAGGIWQRWRPRTDVQSFQRCHRFPSRPDQNCCLFRIRGIPKRPGRSVDRRQIFTGYSQRQSRLALEELSDLIEAQPADLIFRFAFG